MDIQNKINEAMILLPPFESYFMDRIEVPLVQASIMCVSDSYIPYSKHYQIKVLRFVKNFIIMKWEFESKNFD